MSNRSTLSEVLQDLIHIYDERIKKYKAALQENKIKEMDLKSIIERIIEESMLYRDQIAEKIKHSDSEKGKVYQMWPGNQSDILTGKKEFLSALANDQLSLNNIYLSALSFDTSDNEELRNLLLAQQRGIDELYIHIKQFHDAQ